MSSDDPYTHPATNVLINKFGIVDADLLQDAERIATSRRDFELATSTLPGHYDLAHLQGFHRRLFGDIYPWAGEIRTVMIAKSSWFALPQFIRPSADDLFDKLAGEDLLVGLSRECRESLVGSSDGLRELFARTARSA